MLEIIIGAIIGAVVSLTIAEIYHRRASSELKRLTELNDKISNELDILTETISNLEETSELAKKHLVIGTIDDPEYPYQ